ncbi:hypothetical protein H2O64_22535 [Kordia sp. YSTF-M3]|uniref:Tetratricopeptide repeat protein n=1 Tax=Kordia aestuariivivens TaxID=2759037 RepID=A0ABR7QFX4_9FLAO|nr:hypothetical protein [Kordia aestuariivivens]MBC8757465.1 hypothetical protein [Kordia aestuariivivens]
MQHKKYIKGEKLSDEELDSTSEKLIQAKFERDKRKAWEQRLKNEYGVEKEVLQKKRFFKLSKLAIAAAIVGIAGIVLYSIAIFVTPNFETIVNKSIENLDSIDNHALATRGDETIDAQVSAATLAYKNKEYDESIARWETILATESINKNSKGTAYYNLAVCYLQKETSEPQKTIQYLLEARKSKTVQEESNWALALAYLQVNQKENAKDILEEIIHAKAYKYKKAEIIIEFLE